MENLEQEKNTNSFCSTYNEVGSESGNIFRTLTQQWCPDLNRFRSTKTAGNLTPVKITGVILVSLIDHMILKKIWTSALLPVPWRAEFMVPVLYLWRSRKSYILEWSMPVPDNFNQLPDGDMVRDEELGLVQHRQLLLTRVSLDDARDLQRLNQLLQTKTIIRW
jgi:hypothetical protein